jgi:hypothetical protein
MAILPDDGETPGWRHALAIVEKQASAGAWAEDG